MTSSTVRIRTLAFMPLTSSAEVAPEHLMTSWTCTGPGAGAVLTATTSAIVAAVRWAKRPTAALGLIGSKSTTMKAASSPPQRSSSPPPRWDEVKSTSFTCLSEGLPTQTVNGPRGTPRVGEHAHHTWTSLLRSAVRFLSSSNQPSGACCPTGRARTPIWAHGNPVASARNSEKALTLVISPPPPRGLAAVRPGRRCSVVREGPRGRRRRARGPVGPRCLARRRRARRRLGCVRGRRRSG